jgi:hypothetical protein
VCIRVNLHTKKMYRYIYFTKLKHLILKTEGVHHYLYEHFFITI